MPMRVRDLERKALMSRIRRSSIRWEIPRGITKRIPKWMSRWISQPLSRSTRNAVGAAILSITAAASRVQSAHVAASVNPSGIGVAIAVEAAHWQTAKVLSIRTPYAQVDMPRTCSGNSGACRASCGNAMLGPLYLLNFTVTLFMSSAEHGAVDLRCVDIQVGPPMIGPAGASTDAGHATPLLLGATLIYFDGPPTHRPTGGWLCSARPSLLLHHA